MMNFPKLAAPVSLYPNHTLIISPFWGISMKGSLSRNSNDTVSDVTLLLSSTLTEIRRPLKPLTIVYPFTLITACGVMEPVPDMLKSFS